MIGNAAVEIEPAKPPKSQMQFDFLAQSPLKADAIAVAHDQHPDHKLWINRRPANLAVEGCQLLTKSSQQPRHHRIDPAQQMTSRNALFEVEQVEKLALIARLPTHHGKPPPLIASSQTESLFADEREPFFNAIGRKAERLAASIFRPDYRQKADIVDALWHFRFCAIIGPLP